MSPWHEAACGHAAESFRQKARAPQSPVGTKRDAHRSARRVALATSIVAEPVRQNWSLLAAAILLGAVGCGTRSGSPGGETSTWPRADCPNAGTPEWDGSDGELSDKARQAFPGEVDLIVSDDKTSGFTVYFEPEVASHDEQLELLCDLATRFKVDPEVLVSGDVLVTKNL